MTYEIDKIRKIFLKFFQNHNHKIIKSSPLIPPKNSNLLFTNAGMNQFQNIFLGQEKPPALQIATIQKCLRTGGKHNDLEEVGNSLYHNTFFEMLGNFSFGGYFKKEAIIYAWTLLTHQNWFNIPKTKLFVTVYYKDIESYNIWNKIIHIKKKNIIKIYDQENQQYTSDNFWYMGKTGPCGPCTEIFFNKTNDNINTEDLNNKNKYIEIWNIVFIQFNKINNTQFIPLKTLCIDTGMGLERIASILQNVRSNYHIDIFQKIKQSIYKINKSINIKKQESINIISDHIRATIFIILENIFPSNEHRGYILRRIIRRALMHGHKIGIQKIFFYKLVYDVIKIINISDHHIEQKTQQIKNIIKQEELQFIQTLKNGLQFLKSKIKKLKNNELDSNTVFYLYDTIGFPIDLTKDICKEKNIYINYNKLQNIIHHQQTIRKEKKKSNQKINIIHTNITSKFKGYNNHKIVTHVKEIFVNNKKKSTISQHEHGIIFTNTTSFYGESGGQIGDNGIIYNNNAIFKVIDTQNFYNVIGHIGYVYYGIIKINDTIITHINKNKRLNIQNNHSVTHLLYSVLNKVLKLHIEQKGSFINDQYIRFDFSYPHNIYIHEIQEIENIVNEYIQKNIMIIQKNKTFKEAEEQNYHFLKNKNYNNIVHTISIGKFSQEICKGTHAQRTGDIGMFTIISVRNISSGIKRIEAKTGKYALQFIQQQNQHIKKIHTIFKTDKNSCLQKIQKFLNTYNQLKKQNNQFNKHIMLYQEQEIKKQMIKINNINFIFKQTTIKNKKLLKNMINNIMHTKKICIIILFYQEHNKYIFIITISTNLTKIITSHNIIRIFKQYTKGSGGGTLEFAQYVTNNINNINVIIKNIKQYITSTYKSKIFI